MIEDMKTFKTGLGTFFHGRCEDVLNDLSELDPHSFDMILTDPPYGIGYTGRSKERDHKEDAIENDNDIGMAVGILKTIFPLLKRLSTEDSEWYIFASGFTKNKALFKMFNFIDEHQGVDEMIIWDKKSIGVGQDWRKQYETIFQVKHGKGLGKCHKGNVLSFNRTNTKAENHPTTKPFGLLHKLISIKKPLRVLDPFGGSGATAVACERLGIKWVSMDLERKWFDLAEEGIKKENTQGKLF